MGKKDTTDGKRMQNHEEKPGEHWVGLSTMVSFNPHDCGESLPSWPNEETDPRTKSVSSGSHDWVALADSDLDLLDPNSLLPPSPHR